MTKPEGLRRTASVKRAEERYGKLCWRSVSEVIGILSKPALLPWAVGLAQRGLDHREESGRAVRIGSCTHDLVEQMLLAMHGSEGINGHDALTVPSDGDINDALKQWDLGNGERDAVVNCVTAWVAWWNERGHKYKIVRIEERHHDTVNDVGGTWDFEGVDENGDAFILDWKTSAGAYEDYIIQTAAYAFMSREKHGTDIKRVGIVRLDKKTGDYEECWATDEAFAAGLRIYESLAEIHHVKRRLKWVK